MKPSHPRLLRLPIFFLLSLGFSSLAFASNSTVPIEYLRPMKNSVSIGVRVIGGADVTFGGSGLGSISGIDIHDAQTRDTLLTYYGYIPYEDGSVRTDSADASTSTPSRPTQSGVPALPDGRWQTSITLTSTASNPSISVVNGDYLAYDSSGNTTRNWSASNQSQVGSLDGGATNYVDMSTYASNGVQDGQTAHAKSSARPGIELQFGRVIQRYKHFEWGFNFTFGISEFNAKNRQTLQAKAIKYTDRYQVMNYAANSDPTGGFVTNPGVLATGTDGNPVISGPSFKDLPYTDADGNTTDASGNPLVFSNGYETTASLGTGGDYEPQQVTGTDADGNTTDYQSAPGGLINGYWQVKGVYYLFRLGPMIRVPILKNFAATVSAGYIGAWVGSKLRFQEQLIVPGVTFATPKFFTLYDSTGTAITDISQNNQKFLSGAYVDVNFEWWVTTRTGFYAGAVYEKLGSYKQGAYDRTATVRMDHGLGFHFGIITRF